MNINLVKYFKPKNHNLWSKNLHSKFGEDGTLNSLLPLHFVQSIVFQQLYYELLWLLYSSDNADHCC